MIFKKKRSILEREGNGLWINKIKSLLVCISYELIYDLEF